MQPNERRRKIIEYLSFKRTDTIHNLAVEFDVSWNTMRRDIQLLIEEYPLVTTRGNGGGVALPPGYYISQRHLTPRQADTIRRNLNNVCHEDRLIFQSILTDFAW